MQFYRVYFVYILLGSFGLVCGLANNKLKYYEVVDSLSLSHEVRRRSLPEGNGEQKEMTLSILGRTFELALIPNPELFSNDFKAVTVDKNGVETEFFVNKYDFYRGFVKGEEEHSSVTVEVDEDMITASIETKEDTYHLEPAAGQIEGDASNKMIAYKDSDVIWNVTFAGNHTQQEPYCKGIEVDENYKKTSNESKTREPRSTRTRRELKIKRDCYLMLVADYTYFKHIGQSDKRKTQISMVGVINRVDNIFRNTKWSEDPNDDYKGFGFVINKIKIHEEKELSGYAKVFNNRPWKIKDLLEEFSRNDWSEFCLAHLFTYQDFDNGVIGLAYVAHPEANSKGGICSEGDRGIMWHNTGLSSSINWGNQLLTKEADIVTAHELGHNFGSEHDIQDDNTCSPTSGGKFIMYPASVSGQEPNNERFSICSRRSIRAVLASKSSNCFREPDKEQFCGNFRVEEGEECDAGHNSNDQCCNSKCHFKKGAICSDMNSKCCSNCQYARNATLCSQANQLLCKKASYCNGTSHACPTAKPADEGTPCIERGKCDKAGNCEPFCKSLGANYLPCLCEGEENACYVCCKVGKNGTCAVHRNETSGRILMSNGRLCYAGVCRDGKCEKAAQDIVTRLQDFFDTLGDPSKFGEFLKDNIVGTVIVFSLLAWIPLSILVNRIDKRRDKQAQELARWQDLGNQDLIRQPHKRRDNFDVVFKKDAVLIRDSRKARGKGMNPRGRRQPTVE